jgi:hypothetical protein
MQPILHIARLRLTPVVEEDLEQLWALWTDPRVVERRLIAVRKICHEVPDDHDE